ncbi:MAG TPA: hypothetical protein VLF93_04045 [Candidatus Saccharimonadales bacterium]|nr:hypothetical protein [Candidatus Saccharimonadales bacterium]
MAEGGEGPELKVKDRESMQRLAQNVVLERRRRNAPALSEVERHRLEGAQRLMGVGKWNESLEELQGNGREIGRNLRGMVDKFGVRRNDRTGLPRPTVEETARRTRAEAAITALVPILENEGFDQMLPADQARLRGEVRTALLANSRLPDFANMTARDQNEVVDKFLRDPKLKQELLTVLAEVQGMPLTPAREGLEAEKQTALKTVDREEAEEKRTYTTQDLRRIQRQLRDIIRNPATANLGTKAALYLDQITRYEGQLTLLQGAYRVTEGRLGTTSATVMIPDPRGGTRMISAPNPAYQRLERELQTNIQNQEQIQQTIVGMNIERINSVPTEESLEGRIDAKRKDLSDARKEEVEAQFDERGNRIEWREFQEERALQEDAIADRLEGAFSQALTRYVTKELRQSLEHLESNEGKVQEEATKTIRAELARHMEDRWTMRVARNRGIFRRRTTEPAINAAAVNRDFDLLMRAGQNGGVDRLMRDVLRRLRPAGAGNVRAAIPPGQIEELMDDDAFADQMRGELLKNVIARRAILRPFRPGELYQMTNMPAVRESINGALETNEEFRTRVGELTGTNDMDMDNQEFRERFAREVWRQPALLLNPVTGIPWGIWAAVRAMWQGNRNERQQLREQIAA